MSRTIYEWKAKEYPEMLRNMFVRVKADCSMTPFVNLDEIWTFRWMSVLNEVLARGARD